MRKASVLVLLVASLLVVTGAAFAADYQIKWYSINSGGGIL